MHFPWLYEPQLVDVSDVVAELEKKYGKALSSADGGGQGQGRLARGAAVPRASSSPPTARTSSRRPSLKVPDTWEDLYTVGKELKKMGHPVGIPISQNYDSISTAGPVLWSFGGMEVDKDGKTVRINSPATEQMIEWYKKMYRDCMEPEVLSWTDASNNESIQQGKAGWIHNPVSAYIVAKQPQAASPPTASTTTGASAGPTGRHETDVPRHIGIWKFSQERRAGQGVDPLPARQARGLRRVHHVGRRLQPAGATTNLADHPVLKTDPKYAAAQGARASSTTRYGWPAPAAATRSSSSPTRSSCPT